MSVIEFENRANCVLATKFECSVGLVVFCGTFVNFSRSSRLIDLTEFVNSLVIFGYCRRIRNLGIFGSNFTYDHWTVRNL